MAKGKKTGSGPGRPGDATRLRELDAHHILDTAPEPAFDDLALLAAYICETPMAPLSLVDQKRQWFKARIGFPEDQTSRDISFCARAIEQPDDVLIVNDASKDPRLTQAGQLGRAENPVGRAQPHHEEARRGLSLEQSVPLHPLVRGQGTTRSIPAGGGSGSRRRSSRRCRPDGACLAQWVAEAWPAGRRRRRSQVKVNVPLRPRSRLSATVQ